MAKYSSEQIDAFHLAYRSMPATLTVVDVARQMRVPANTLRNWIKKNGWERDLSAEVRRRTNIAVTKAALGLDTSRPLNDEESAIADRVALNVAIMTQHQDWLGGFGKVLNELLQQLTLQVTDNVVAVMDKETGEYKAAVKSLAGSIPEARQLMATFSDYSKAQMLAHGINGESDEADIDTVLRELAEEAAAHMPDGNASTE